MSLNSSSINIQFIQYWHSTSVNVPSISELYFYVCCHPCFFRTQTFLMTTILEEPYMMLTKPRKGVQLTGNDRYEGYCKVI